MLRSAEAPATLPRVSHWINGQPDPLARGELRCAAKTRYRQADQRCRVTLADGGISVFFDQPQWAVTPGQYLVIYDGDRCLGGAPIGRVWQQGANNQAVA